MNKGPLLTEQRRRLFYQQESSFKLNDEEGAIVSSVPVSVMRGADVGGGHELGLINSRRCWLELHSRDPQFQHRSSKYPSLPDKCANFNMEKSCSC